MYRWHSQYVVTHVAVGEEQEIGVLRLAEMRRAVWKVSNVSSSSFPCARGATAHEESTERLCGPREVQQVAGFEIA